MDSVLVSWVDQFSKDLKEKETKKKLIWITSLCVKWNEIAIRGLENMMGIPG
jgi:hypothetical protein